MAIYAESFCPGRDRAFSDEIENITKQIDRISEFAQSIISAADYSFASQSGEEFPSETISREEPLSLVTEVLRDSVLGQASTI